ncbi:MAG: IPT/TIG domain-containing protein [Deltaproteobacteria bacterium]|nr:IPT/TIG domain-containing protein [Deltaproteobacteria bacterium]
MRRQSLPSLTAIGVVVHLFGCGSPGPQLQANLKIELAQTAAAASYAEVEATQGDGRVRAVLDAAGTATLRVSAGLETRLAGTVFDLQPQIWDGFEGSHIFTPLPGANDVAFEVAAVAAREIAITPVFDTGVALASALPVTVHDEATGFENLGLFTTQSALRLPAGRAFSLAIEWPGAAGSVSIAVPPDSGAALAFDAVVGVEPQLTVPALPIYATGTAIDLSSLQDPVFTVQCAVGTECDDSLPWTDCGTAFDLGASLPVDTEGGVTVQVRFRDIPALGCDSFRVLRDKTPPSVAVGFDPPLFTAARNVIVTVSADEPLATGSLSLVAVGVSTPTFAAACSAFAAAPPTGAAAARYRCTLDLSAWTVAAGSVAVTVNGADSAANPFTARAVLPYVPAPTGLVVLGARTLPPVIEAGQGSFLFGLDVANFGGEDLCALSALGYFVTINDGAGSQLPTYAVNLGDLSLGYLPVSTPAAPDVRVMWARGTASDFLLPDTYSVVAAPVSTSVCATGSIGPSADLPASSQFRVDPAHLRPVTTAPYYVGLPTIMNGSVRLQSLVLGETPTTLWTSDNPTTIRIDQGDGFMELSAVAPGHARLTAADPTRPEAGAATLEVEVVTGPTLAVLQADQVVQLASGERKLQALDPALFGPQGSTPLRLLWESARDAFIAVTPTGVQIFDAASAGTYLAPCGGATTHVLDATLTAAAPAHARPQADLVLLTDDGAGYGHCEIDLDNPAAGVTTPLPATITDTCPTLSRIVADPVSGQFTVVGNVVGARASACAASYFERGAGITNVIAAAAPALAADAVPERALLDPKASFVLLSAYSAASAPAYRTVGGFGLGPTLAPTNPFDLSPPGTANNVGISDLALDPLTGAALVAAYSTPAGSLVTAHLFQYPDRIFTGQAPRAAPVKLTTGAGTGFFWTRLAVDGAARLLFAVDTFVTPGVWALDLDNLAGIQFGGGITAPLLSNEATFDMLVAGPQPLGITPRRASGGSLVTITGIGFAGGGVDEVYVRGIKAQVTTSTTTSVTFQVPTGLVQAYNDGYARSGVPVTVRSHGRMSAPVPSPFAVDAPRPSHVILGRLAAAGQACPVFGSCLKPAVLDAATGLLAARYENPVTGSDTLTAYDTAGSRTWEAPTAGSNVAVTLAGDRQAVGHHVLGARGDAPGFVLYRTAAALNAVGAQDLAETPRAFTGTFVPAVVPAMAADPSGRYLAYTDGTKTHLSWGANLAPTAFGAALPAGGVASPQRLVFSLDGNTLAAAGSDGRLDLFDVSAAPATVTPGLAATGCPAGTPKLVGIWPRARGTPEVVTLLAYGGSQLVALATVTLGASGWTYDCTDQLTLAPGAAVVDAALSPLGDTLLLYQQVQSGLGHQLSLVSADDLATELDRVVLLGSPQYVGFVAGHNAGGPSIVIIDASDTLVSAVDVAR